MKATKHRSVQAGQEILWRQWGPVEAHPVLALHCSLSHGGEWVGVAAACPGLGVAAPDLAGHGRMPSWDGTRDLHDDSTAIARALALRLGQGGPVDVIGHSFGGTVALRLALERPDLVRRLILVEPVLFAAARESAAWEAFCSGHRVLETLHASGQTEALLRAFLDVWGSGDAVDQVIPELHQYMLERIGLVMDLNGWLVQDPLGLLAPGRIEALDRPVLLVEGQESPRIVAAIHDALAAGLPRASRSTVPGARHMVPVTHAEALAPLVRGFLGTMGEP